MIQHFLEERFHKAVRFFTGIKTKDIDAIGNVKVTGSLSLNGDAVARPYKVYTALLTQSGTDAPVATVLENTLGGAVVWTRAGAGTYVGTLAGAFPENKTFPIPSKYPISNGSNTLVVDIYRISDNQIVFFNAGSFDISALSGMDKNFAIEIRVYE